MNISRTTISGAIAGAATAAQAVPNLPPLLHAGLAIAAGAALGALGLHASGCPPNCPGTDETGRLRPGPVRALRDALMVFAILAAVALAATGCAFVHASSRDAVTVGTNSLPRKASFTGIAFFDSSQSLSKARVTYEGSTNGAWAPGICMSGLNQTSSSTGAVTIIQQFRGMLPAP